MEGSFSLFSADGQIKDQGTFTILWVDSEKAKILVTSGQLSYAQTATAKGLYRSGERTPDSTHVIRALWQLVNPVPLLTGKTLESIQPKAQLHQFGDAKLNCLTFFYQGTEKPLDGWLKPAYCVREGSPILRISSVPFDVNHFDRNDIVEFQGRYVPLDLTEGDGKTRKLAIHVSSLQQIKTFGDAVFTPSPDAVFVPQPKKFMQIDAVSMARMVTLGHIHIRSHPEPEYPAAAKGANIHGTVRLYAEIGSDGHMDALDVIDGPSILQQAALNAVWQWGYEPVLDHGQPVVVVTEIDVKF